LWPRLQSVSKIVLRATGGSFNVCCHARDSVAARRCDEDEHSQAEHRSEQQEGDAYPRSLVLAVVVDVVHQVG